MRLDESDLRLSTVISTVDEARQLLHVAIKRAEDGSADAILLQMLFELRALLEEL